ncbi:MAG: cytochrome c [Leptospiraceae bacterium]|nr:cytochrome c [Leptospiraceae bacterium]
MSLKFKKSILTFVPILSIICIFTFCANQPDDESLVPKQEEVPIPVTVPIDEALYRQNGCESCHGGNGSGVVERKMNTKPADFRVKSSYKNGSSLPKIVKSIQNGIQGTEMKAYTHLTLYEITSIAKYIQKMQDE